MILFTHLYFFTYTSVIILLFVIHFYTPVLCYQLSYCQHQSLLIFAEYSTQQAVCSMCRATLHTNFPNAHLRTRVGYDLLSRRRNYFYCLPFGLFGFCNFVSAKFLCRPVPSTASTKQTDNEVGFSCLADCNNDVTLFICHSE